MRSPIRPALRALAAASLLVAAAACGSKGGSTTTPPVCTSKVDPDSAAVRHFDRTSFAGSTLTVATPALGTDERLAILLLNEGGVDHATVTVSAPGTTVPPAARLAPPAATAAELASAPEPELASRAPMLAGHELARSRREAFLARGEAALAQLRPAGPSAALAPTLAGRVGDTRSFCVFDFGTQVTTSRAATLRHVSSPGALAEFWVTDDAWARFQTATAARSDFFTVLDAAYETHIVSALNTFFGPESDADGNGRMIFLFTDLGKTSSGFAVGYFDPTDVFYPRDASCTGSKSNGADLLYLLDPASFVANGPTLDSIVDGEYPGTMAHELQHNVNFNVRCLRGGNCSVPEETWVNEGLSMVSEDVAGYGLHTTSERSRVRQYLDTHVAWSLTTWESDPIGNYGGAHAFMRYWLDQVGDAFTTTLETPSLVGKANVQNATCVDFATGFGRFVTASLVSNEDLSIAANAASGTIHSASDALADPIYSYRGDSRSPAYVPWHHYAGTTSSGAPTPRTAYVNWTPVSAGRPASVSLRADGWDVLVTAGTGGPATVTVTTSAAVKPRVTVIRYSGTLPDAFFNSSL